MPASKIRLGVVTCFDWELGSSINNLFSARSHVFFFVLAIEASGHLFWQFPSQLLPSYFLLLFLSLSLTPFFSWNSSLKRCQRFGGYFARVSEPEYEHARNRRRILNVQKSETLHWTPPIVHHVQRSVKLHTTASMVQPALPRPISSSLPSKHIMHETLCNSNLSRSSGRL